jgi:REP-associated tyrosine transposase
MFLALLDATVRRYEWCCHAYCLIGNHFHLLVDTPRANISAGMQFLKGEYAAWFNAVSGREGAFFERRFWSRIAVQEGYAFELSRYIALNPVRAGFTRSPADWPWSSYAATVGLEGAPSFLTTSRILDLFGGGGEACVRYAQFVGEGIGDASLSDEPFLLPAGSDPVG